VSQKKNSEERLCLIVNPRSGGGATAGRIESIRAQASETFETFDLWTTEGQGHATTLARTAAKEGYDLVVAVGGDGTASEVVNGLFDGKALVNPNSVFSVIPAGTGSDLIKTLGIPLDLRAAFRVLQTGNTRRSDVIYIDASSNDGDRKVTRICINVAGFGMNGEVVRQSNLSSKRWGAKVTFLGAMFRTLASYRSLSTRVDWTTPDGVEDFWEGKLSSAFIANGQYCGGGMWVGRGGSMDDGVLDLTIVPDLGLPKMIKGTPRLFSGTIDKVKGVLRTPVIALSAKTMEEGPAPIDVDGEQPASLPLSAEVIPKVLRIRGLW
jgi:diacylglycerol kinase (ATP)